MTIMMSENYHQELTTATQAFIDPSSTRQWPLIEWQRILEWINWGINAYPLRHPALQPAYAKISGKQISQTQLYLNRAVIHHFWWLADTIDASDSTNILDAKEWGRSDTNLVI